MASKIRFTSAVVLYNLLALVALVTTSEANKYGLIKEAFFNDPHTYYQYRVAAYNATSMTTGSTYRSNIRISRVKLDEKTLKPIGNSELVQTINSHPTLVDFDLNCQKNHCYLVTISSRSKRNLKLYGWWRTQFDVLAERDTFARPHSVKLFRIRSEFYVSIAQDQMHLTSFKLGLEEPYEEPRFVGCAILKFKKGEEQDIRYHQFIKLPFNPFHVQHFVNYNSHLDDVQKGRPFNENHFLVFSVRRNWTDHSEQAYSFIWSALDNYFWPYRLPRSIKLQQPIPGSLHRVITIPTEPYAANLSRTQSNLHYEPVESCFHQLQAELARRQDSSQRLISHGRSLWRSALSHPRKYSDPNPRTDIGAQVYVHGSVIVKGQFVKAPRMSLVGYRQPNVTSLMRSHSPTNVDDILAKALIKLKLIREKLSKAVYRDTTNVFKSYIRFFGLLEARRMIFDSISGISNSDVRINGIPFNQLQHELVSLRGSQNIPSRVVFSGNVVADLLEIHSQVNGKYFIRNAVDITSSNVQVIDLPSFATNGSSRFAPLIEFHSIESPELNIDRVSTINGVLIDDVVTRDPRPQIVTGHKWIDHLTMSRLELADPNVTLNNHILSQIASNAVLLRGTRYQRLTGKNSFSMPVTVNKLFIHNSINGHINMSALIHDSIKSSDARPQYIYGHKKFLAGLTVNNMVVHGSINGIKPKRVFSINPIAEEPELSRLEGSYVFDKPVVCSGNLNVRALNEVDIFNRAIRRSGADYGVRNVRGKKIFRRPITVLNQVRMSRPINATSHPPVINGIDIRDIKQGLDRQMQSPRLVYVDNLIVRGNLDLDLTAGSYSRSVIGSQSSSCPLEAIQSRFVLGGGEDQMITNPIQIRSLRASSIYVYPAGLNGLDLPGDFVLRSNARNVEPVYGLKNFRELIITPPFLSRPAPHRYTAPNYQPPWIPSASVVFGNYSSINDVTQVELQAFVTYERQRNSTGEKLIQTLNVYGDIWTNRVNGYHWPDDILLKSIASRVGPINTPYMHKRIYSPLVFVEPQDLLVENQLVLRGPIHLRGRLNGVNLTEFAHQSVTFGDKDLLSVGRALRNKFFAGGLTVRHELKSQGLIDGVDIEDMKRRVVSVKSTGRNVLIQSPKMFMSDVDFLSPLHINYLNDVPIDNYLHRIRIEPDNVIRLHGKKTISGTLRINKLLEVQGLINGKDFLDIKAHAIPLNPTGDLVFNKTLTVEGDVFMDNLIIDEKNGVLDGIKLVDLLPVNLSSRNEIVLTNPKIDYYPGGDASIRIDSFVQDCQVTCSLTPQSRSIHRSAIPPVAPVQSMSYQGPRRTLMNKTTIPQLTSAPPYVTPFIQQPRLYRRSPLQYPGRNELRQSLILRKPIGIQYEIAPLLHRYEQSIRSPMISDQLEHLRYHIVSLNLVRPSSFNKYVIGFIESDSNNIASYQLTEEDAFHTDHLFNIPSFLQLDQIDFPFRPTTYHISVGVLTGRSGSNLTSVFSSIGGGPPRQLSTLPVESPNNAMFFKLPQQHGLGLLISEDYSVSDKYGSRCPLHLDIPIQYSRCESYASQTLSDRGGIHVYMFHALFNSSYLQQAYFDLYQTIDLPAIDSFEHFEYNESAYVLAGSRALNRIYLLILRGYSGFQVVSNFDVPMLERIKVIKSPDNTPAVIVHQTDGLHRIMEPVII